MRWLPRGYTLSLPVQAGVSMQDSHAGGLLVVLGLPSLHGGHSGTSHSWQAQPSRWPPWCSSFESSLSSSTTTLVRPSPPTTPATSLPPSWNTARGQRGFLIRERDPKGVYLCILSSPEHATTTVRPYNHTSTQEGWNQKVFNKDKGTIASRVPPLLHMPTPRPMVDSSIRPHVHPGGLQPRLRENLWSHLREHPLRGCLKSPEILGSWQGLQRQILGSWQGRQRQSPQHPRAHQHGPKR